MHRFSCKHFEKLEDIPSACLDEGNQWTERIFDLIFRFNKLTPIEFKHKVDIISEIMDEHEMNECFVRVYFDEQHIVICDMLQGLKESLSYLRESSGWTDRITAEFIKPHNMNIITLKTMMQETEIPFIYACPLDPNMLGNCYKVDSNLRIINHIFLPERSEPCQALMV